MRSSWIVVPPDGYVVDAHKVSTLLRTTVGLRVEVEASVVDSRLRDAAEKGAPPTTTTTTTTP